MQKSKKKKWLCLLLMLCFGITRVSAACDNDKLVELSRQANNIKANYEIIEEEYELEDYDVEELEVGTGIYLANYVHLNVHNITKDIYVKISDDSGEYEEEIHYSDTEDGTYSLRIDEGSIIRHFSINVYSENPCTVDLLRKIEVITPMKNEYHYLPACEGSEAFYCQEWVNVEVTLSSAEIMEKEIKRFKEHEEVQEEPDFWEKNKNILITGTIIVFGVAIVGVGFAMIKRKRSKAI